MWFQIVLIVAMVGIAIYLMRSTPSARHLAIRRVLVFLALAAGVVVVLAPGWLSAIARLVGIGRGADLLSYSAIVAFLFYVVVEYKRSVELNRTNTRLAREITLLRSRLDDEVGRRSDDDTAR
jgi:hypothetical protein